MSSLIKEINRLISKGINVFLFDILNGCSFGSIKEINRYVKHLPLRKTNVLNALILSERKFEEMHYLWRAKRYRVYLGKSLFWHALPLKSKMVQGIFGETVILALLSSAVFRLQNRVSDFVEFVLTGR